ncbi:MAG: cobalamin-binding protein [Gemmatimonadota bacterium]|nr:cobalamin-binding protein [Gemmatimonadota bacterium]
MPRFRPSLLQSLLLALLGAGACRDSHPDARPASSRDAASPRRIVSLNPATTEMLFALGAGARVVGRTHWDSYPESARAVPDLGDGLRPNVEAVLAARPDLVILYASADNRAAEQRLRAAGVRTLSLRIDRLEDFVRAMEVLGNATGTADRAGVVVDSVQASLERVARATAALPRVRVFWHVWDNPVFTIGGGSYLTQLVDIAGGRNVYGELAAASPQVTLEDVVRRDPDVILAGPAGARSLRRSPAWHAVAAVSSGHILVVDTTLVGRPSVRLGEAARSLAALLHPGAVP